MPVKIDKEIVGFAVKQEVVQELEQITTKTKRPFMLKGSTYKIKPPNSDSALYMTINDMVTNEGTKDEKWQAYEMFINSKHMDSYPWIALVTRLVSAIFRIGGDASFIIEEFESIFDPSNGYFGKIPNKDKGKYYNSYISELGAILRYHMEQLGTVKKVLTIAEENNVVEPDIKSTTGLTCPDCGEPDMKIMDGCPTCVNGCGYSKCG